MKLSKWEQSFGSSTELILDYNNSLDYDIIYLAKVFTKTEVPDAVLGMPNLIKGGTGFGFDEKDSGMLPFEIEHFMPDYHLYEQYVKNNPKSTEYYKDYSVGFTTRGCFRKCGFCVNKKYDRCHIHSNINEFVDAERPYICLLDDNLFAYPKWLDIINSLKDTGKPFVYKQGLDVRLMTDDKAAVLSNIKYKGDMLFAFDNYKDKELIESKLAIWRKHTDLSTRIYLLSGYEGQDYIDILKLFDRIETISKYDCLPYVMKYDSYLGTEWESLYTAIANWCNQPQFFKKMTFREFCIDHSMKYTVYNQYKNNPSQYLADGNSKGKQWRVMEQFEKKYPDIASVYFDTILYRGN